jgi:hypothetical protein
MKVLEDSNIKDIVLAHVVFAVLCVIVLLIPIAAEIGLRLLILVIAYNVLIPLFAVLRDQRNWIPLWLFSIILSIFMIMPDWYLADVLGTIVFPEDGFPKIGSVSTYMAGLWAIPIFVILFVGNEVRNKKSEFWGYLIVAFLSVLIFGIAEESMWMLPSWSAVGVTMIGHVAVYIIVPEIFLGLSTFFCYLNVKDRSYIWWILGAFVVMVFYIGCASFFYFIIERLILGG